MKRFLQLLFITIAVALWAAGPARAHANLVRSVPKAGEVLAQAPAEIILEFSEGLDPAVSRVELYDVKSRLVVPGPGVIEPDSPHVLRLPLDALPDGVYSAVWRTRSAVDGHTANGSVGFSIGESSPAASLLPPPGTPDPATRLPASAEVIARWLADLSAVAALGSLSFGFLVWRPAYGSQKSQLETSEETVRRIIQRVSLIGLVSLALATLGFAIVLAAEAQEVSPWEIFKIPFSQLFAGRVGLLLGVRLVLIVILGWFVWRLPSPGAGAARDWWVLMTLAGLLLLTFSLQGHGAARGSLLGVVMIWLHLAATTIWLGGLPILFLVLRGTSVPAAVLVPRFSAAALASVGTIAATGTYNAFTYVGTLEALTATSYGRVLLVKTGIFALLFMLGGVNLFYISPHLREAGNRARDLLGRTVRTEMALGILLLLAVGVLSGVAPAFEALQARQEQGVIETASVDGVDMLVRVVPAQPGDNEIGVEFSDSRPGVDRAAPQVLLRLTSESMDMGTQQVEATSLDGLRYTARGSYFPMTGPWVLEVIIRRSGFNDVRHSFELAIQDTSSP